MGTEDLQKCQLIRGSGALRHTPYISGASGKGWGMSWAASDWGTCTVIAYRSWGSWISDHLWPVLPPCMWSLPTKTEYSGPILLAFQVNEEGSCATDKKEAEEDAGLPYADHLQSCATGRLQWMLCKLSASFSHTAGSLYLVQDQHPLRNSWWVTCHNAPPAAKNYDEPTREYHK